MPMGALNAASTFVVMIMKLQMEWYTLAKQRGLKNVAQNNIVDDVLLYGRTAKQFLSYFRTFVNVLKHHRATIKLKK